MVSQIFDRKAGLSSAAAYKGPCLVATTANITLSGQQTIDGVAVVSGDRVLVKNQTDAKQNGIWYVDTGDWKRAADFSRVDDVVKGTRVVVTDGTQAGSYQLDSEDIDFLSVDIVFINAPGVDLLGAPFATTGIDSILVLENNQVRQSFAYPYEPITNFGAVSEALAAPTTTKLNAAAAAHKLPYVPVGAWRLNALNANTCSWLIDPEATFPDLPVVGPHSIPNLSAFGGVIDYRKGDAYTGRRIGSGEGWLEAFRNYSESIAEVSVISKTGGYGLIGASRASDNPPANFQTIGIGGFAYNDNTTNKEPAWPAYLEGGRLATAGAVLGLEIDVWNADTVSTPLTPYTTRSTTSTDTINLWLSAGGGTGSPGHGQNSAAIGIHDNGQKFERGIVFMNGAIDSTVNEAMALYKGLKLAWYDTTAVAQSFIHGDASVFTTKSDTATSGHETEYRRKRANGTTATGALDEVHVDRFAGWDGAALYYGGYTQCLQVAAFAAGLARFRYDIAAKNDAGAYKEISLNGAANNTYSSTADNDINLGGASNRWARMFANEVRPGAGTVIWTSGAGTPEGILTAPVGSLFTRTDGGAGTTLYVKESGAGNTGWVGK